MTSFISVCFSGIANLKQIEEKRHWGVRGHALRKNFENLHRAMAFLVLLNKF